MEDKFLALETSLNMILDRNVEKDARIEELEKIEEYAEGLVNLSEEKKASLKAVMKAFERELFDRKISEECIEGYYRILKELLNMEQGWKGKKCIVYGNNWLSDEIENKMRAKNYIVFNWSAVNPAYLDEFDLYILCDEPLKIYNLSEIEDKEKLIKLWDYLKYKYVVFPSVYETLMNLEKAAGDEVKGIVTGGRNVANAIRSDLLRTNTISVANRSQDVFYDFKLFCQAYESMPNLEYVIIGLTPYSLRYDTSKSKAEWRRCLVYYPVVETMHNCKGAEQLVELYKTEQSKVRRYFETGYLESLFELFKEVDFKPEIGGNAVFDDASLTQEMTEHNLREISALYNRPYTDILLQNRVLLEEYVHFCNMKGIKVIFFVPPYTKWYKEHMKKSYYEELISTLKILCPKYDAQLIDMMNVSLPDSCFKDYANINNIGAVKVASYINEALENK